MQIPGAAANLAFQSEPNYQRPAWPATGTQQQMMLHLDIGATCLSKAVGSAEKLGATLAESQPQSDVRVMFDPAGHPFCLYEDA